MGDILNNLPAMPDNIGGSLSFDQIIGHLGVYFNGLIDKLVGMIPAPLMAIYNEHKVLFLLALVCILALVAFEGYRFFRMLTYAGSAFLFGLVGYWYISPMVADTLQPMLPDVLDVHVLVAVVCALVALLLCCIAFNLMIFILGGGAGFMLGTTVVYSFLVTFFSSLTFLQTDTVKYIVGGVLAVICALIFTLMFKILFMLATSFGGSIAAALILQSILVPGGDGNVKIAFAILGVVLGILALIRQRKQENDIIFRI